jgi:hypothetical protein
MLCCYAMLGAARRRGLCHLQRHGCRTLAAQAARPATRPEPSPSSSCCASSSCCSCCPCCCPLLLRLLRECPPRVSQERASARQPTAPARLPRAAAARPPRRRATRRRPAARTAAVSIAYLSK